MIISLIFTFILSYILFSISKADIKDGGEGAIYIFLKDNKRFKE